MSSWLSPLCVTKLSAVSFQLSAAKSRQPLGTVLRVSLLAYELGDPTLIFCFSRLELISSVKQILIKKSRGGEEGAKGGKGAKSVKGGREEERQCKMNFFKMQSWGK